MQQQKILQAIEQADDFLLHRVTDSVLRRYASLFPDWDVLFISVRKEADAREKDVEGHIRFLKGMKKKDSLG